MSDDTKLADSATSTFTFPGGWEKDVEQRLDNLKQLAESDAVKRLEARYADDLPAYEVVVTITTRRKA